MGRLRLINCLIPDFKCGSGDYKCIMIENGKIKRISESVSMDGDAQTIDVMGNYTMPGFIDCHTHLGIIEEGTGKIGVDNNETSEPVTPQIRGIDAINPLDIAFSDAVKSGITTVMSGPGSDNAVGGTSVAVKTYGRIIDKMILKNPVGLKIALGENPISTYGIDSRCPVTRMGTASLIRELFMRAQDYMDLKKRGGIKYRDLKLESVLPVLKGEISLRAHAHRADDIVTAIRIAEEFNIKKLVIEHGTEAHIVKDYLKEKNVPVAFGPMLTPRIKMELKMRRYSSVLELAEAGIKVALITDHPYNSIDQLRTIAILAVSQGMKVDDAVKSITVHPAEILECQGRIGRIEEGYDADIVVFDGNPLNISSRVVMTIINGKVVYKA